MTQLPNYPITQLPNYPITQLPKFAPAAVLTGLEQIEIRPQTVPPVTAGTLLLKILACGVCGSDVRIFHHGHSRVHYPAIPGHEIAAEVVAVGKNVSQFQVGDKVSLGADIPCGRCRWCQNGQSNCCEQNYAMGYQFPGGFAHYCLLDEMMVQYGPIARIPDGLDIEQAALAEPLACCLNGLERVAFKPGQSVLILGAGPIGIMLAQAARAFGSPLVILADVDGRRLEMAGLAGADYLLDTATSPLIAAINDITKGRGMDVVFTACPSPAAQEEALKVVGTRGTVNFFGGLPGDSAPIALDSNLIHYKEITITGSHGSTPRQHALALDLIASGRINLAGLITHHFPLAQIEQALAAARSRAGLKVMVLPHA
jgi:L-iditol 2-dehydrogenase